LTLLFAILKSLEEIVATNLGVENKRDGILPLFQNEFGWFIKHKENICFVLFLVSFSFDSSLIISFSVFFVLYHNVFFGESFQVESTTLNR
jgi:hypothetical protein